MKMISRKVTFDQNGKKEESLMLIRPSFRSTLFIKHTLHPPFPCSNFHSLV